MEDVEPVRSAGTRAWNLFLISFLALFFELALIRWIPTRLRLLAYFSNFILIASLLGLGIGMIIGARRRPLLQLFPFGFTLIVLVVVLLESSGVALPLATENEFIWNGLSRASSDGPKSYAILVGFFALTSIVFVPLGQEMGLQLQKFKPIPGYSINILGSLLGVVGFAILSYLQWPPVAWFSFGAAGFLLFLLTSKRTSRLWLVMGGVVLASGLSLVSVAHDVQPGRYFWSPYYEVRVSDIKLPTGEKVGFDVAVNQDSHQQALDLSDTRPASSFLDSRRQLYDLPYTVAPTDDVLVLGAGTGNDVAAALRADAKAVQAVEIDPVIARLGKQHPERPYADPRVDVAVDDARSYLEKHDHKYDLIVFGFLDSHRLFSSMSSVRLDNYIYTKENIANVRRHLTDDGVLSLTFTVHEQWIADRLYGLLTNVFGHEPTVYQGNEQAWGTTFLIKREGTIPTQGDVISKEQFASEILPAGKGNTWAYAAKGGYLDNKIFNANVEVPTDDWPYLYMLSRRLPSNYVWVLLLTFVVAALMIRTSVPTTGLSDFANWNFLFLGAAFALLETKGITDIALLFGSTWITNSIVISAVLLMILLANLVVLRFERIPLAPVYALLGLSLLFNYSVSFESLLGFSYEVRLLLAGLQVSFPLFFAGIIFATHFKSVSEPSVALGSNLIGAMAGGLLEYSSIIAGHQALYILAFIFYACSLLALLASKSPGTVLRSRRPKPTYP